METAYLSDVPLYTDGSDHLYNLRRDTNEMIWEAHNLTDDEKAYLSDQEDSLSTPYIYEYCGSYKSILSSTVILTIMISFLTAICIPPVSADEHSRRTDQVILCTRFGRRPAFLAKIIAAASFAMCAVLLLFASASLPSFLIYGTEGCQAQIQVSLPGCSWDLTMGQAVLILTGISLAVADNRTWKFSLKSSKQKTKNSGGAAEKILLLRLSFFIIICRNNGICMIIYRHYIHLFYRPVCLYH